LTPSFNTFSEGLSIAWLKELFGGRMSDVVYLTAKRGKIVSVSLEANPSTGYEWVAEFDPAFLKLVRKETVSAASLVGGGGTEKFEFEALRSGITRLRMVYKRAWETAKTDEKTYIIEIA
jgi:inhibitor of cysteine peptidase